MASKKFLLNFSKLKDNKFKWEQSANPTQQLKQQERINSEYSNNSYWQPSANWRPTTGDTQSICSSSIDAGSTLSHRTHLLSSSLILAPTTPAYYNTNQQKTLPRMSSPAQHSNLNALTNTTTTLIPQFCCECSSAQNRCSTDLCPCYAQRRMCDEHCESARYFL